MKVKVSIVIPVYNVSAYLMDCLESVKNQTLKDIEIICINDASTDNSLEILTEYAQSDSRIVVINNSTNKGVATTRNIGADYANGKYLYFLDSDDLITIDAMEKCYLAAEKNNADVVVIDMKVFADGALKEGEHLGLLSGYKRTKAYQGICKGHDLFADFMLDKNYIANVPVHFFNRAYYTLHNFSFVDGILYEDLPVTLEALVIANRVIHLSEQLYLRRIRPESILTVKKTFRHAYGLWKNYVLLNDILKKYSLPIHAEKQVVNIMCGRLIRARDLYRELDKEEASQYMSLTYYERVI